MQFSRKLLLLAIAPAIVLLSGCSGIHTTQGVSPASFLLPGLLKVEPQNPLPSGSLQEVPPSLQVAQLQ